jgi:hypothetical protein
MDTVKALYGTEEKIDFSFLYEHEKGLDAHILPLLDGTSYREPNRELLIAALRGTLLVLWTILSSTPFFDRDKAYLQTVDKVKRRIEFHSQETFESDGDNNERNYS